MEELEIKYIRLLLCRCLNFKQSKSLFIHCDLKEHLEFALKVKEEANKMGIMDVCILVNDLDDIHGYLKDTSLEDIALNPLIDRSLLNTYAKKNAAILFLRSSVPGIMSDIPIAKIDKMTSEIEKTITYYRQNVSRYTFPWTIATLPNERWAKSIFGDDKEAYQRLYLNILKMCMVDMEDPILAWDSYIDKSNEYKKVLNSLGITKMHYQNSLGTDLTLGIPSKASWLNQDKEQSYGKIIVNMPSYEIFITPDFHLTEGIVYSSKPLFYGGCCIDNFWLEFHKGKVVGYDAKKGLNVLKQLLASAKNVNYLGEAALVPYNSPISNTGLVFNETLFDENASCHLALGSGFPKCFKNSANLSLEELEKMGMNYSRAHVDFMMGTSDLAIEAETAFGRRLIFKDGNFNL